MATITEKTRNVEGLIDPANGDRSFEVVNVDASGGALVAGNVLGQVTIGGDYVAYDEGETNGAEDVAGILLYSVEAVEGDATILKRDATFRTANLTYTGTEATVLAGLVAINIIARS